MSKGPSFFAELKRRNVYKVAIAYAVTGWASAEGASQIFPVFDIPNWAVRLVVLAIVIGFPIALVIAWAYELTPEGLKRTEDADRTPSGHRPAKRAWIFVVVIAGGISLGLFFFRPLHGAHEQQCVFRRVAGKIDRGLALRQHERESGQR